MDREQLLNALEEVALELGLRSVTARVYIVGGAAMALAYDAARVTRDIDGVILDGHGPLTEVVREVGRRRGLPGSWLNEQASAYVPTSEDPRGRLVFDHPSLRVIAASPERLLAMKVRAARRPDIADIARLTRLLEMKSAQEVFDLVEAVYPGDPVPDRGIRVVEELFERNHPKPSAAAIGALAPTGSLRAGINLSNFLLVSGTDEWGDPVGVSPDLARALADELDVPLKLVTFANPGELADAATEDAWDIGNIGADPARAEHIAFSSPYSEIEATYLVRGGSPIMTISDVDRQGIRIVTKARAAYTLWLERSIEHAELIQTDSLDASFTAFVNDGVDVLAGLKPRLLTDADNLPGARILDGRFTSVQQAIGTPRDREPAGIEYLEAFVEAVISSEFVAQLIDTHHVTGRLAVASVR